MRLSLLAQIILEWRADDRLGLQWLERPLLA
jgi:hypothetical protein